MLLSYHAGHGAGRSCRNRVAGQAVSGGSGSSRSDLAPDFRQDSPSIRLALEENESPSCPRYLAPQLSQNLLKRFSRFMSRIRHELATQLVRAQGFCAPRIRNSSRLNGHDRLSAPRLIDAGLALRRPGELFPRSRRTGVTKHGGKVEPGFPP